MIQSQKDKYFAYGIAALVHLIVFIAICFAGLFTQISSNRLHNIDVDIYEVEAVKEAGGGGGGAGQMTEALSSVPDVETMSFAIEAEKLPEIAEEYTKEPEKQQQYRQEHRGEDKLFDESSNNTLEKGSAGIGVVQGNGIGTGTGNGSGIGTGSGTGNGEGEGNSRGAGRDEGAAMAAKIPPRFLGGSNPVYPEDLQEQGIGGTVALRLTVSASGVVVDVDIVSSSGVGQLDKAAVKAAYTYRFAPARNVYDEPVICIMNKKVVFEP